MDIRLALMAGSDIPIPECQLVLHQPTIKEISYIGGNDFFMGTQCLSVYKSMFIEDETVLSQITNFQIFMTIMQDKSTVEKKQCVLQVLQLIFPKYKIFLSPSSLIFQPEEGDNLLVDDGNFDAFQEVLRRVFCNSTGPMDQQSFNPANAQAKAIADKLMKGRQRAAAQHNAANTDIFSMYISILSIGLHIPITSLLDYTLYQLYDEMERFSLYMNWDLDVRTRLAGGKPDGQPENWMKNIHEND